MADLSNLPADVDDWTKDHVKLWVTGKLKLDSADADILYNEHVTGMILRILTKKDFCDMGIKQGPAAFLVNGQKALTTQSKEVKQKSSSIVCGQQAAQNNVTPSSKTEKNLVKTEGNLHNELGNLDVISSDKVNRVRVTPYPFDTFTESKSYTQYHLLPSESGTFNYIDPIHEYKEFTNTQNATEEDKKMKFCNEIFKFASACMNARTNGTIHFGVRDKPHGQIVGVPIDNTETFVKYHDEMIVKYFQETQLHLVKNCIRPPRFVSVLHEQNTQSDLVVIEVDVVSDIAYCGSQIFSIFQYIYEDKKKDKKKDEDQSKEWRKSKELYCFLRDGGSSKKKNVEELYFAMKSRDENRKRAEDRSKTKQKCNQVDGSKLANLLTGNRGSLDNSYYKWFILVVNKCPKFQEQDLCFIQELNWFAILDFDPESVTNGLCKVYKQNRKPNLHFPHQYQKMENLTQENIEDLKLYQQPSWIFCNGRHDLEGPEYEPLKYNLWHKEKADDVRNLISIFAKKDIMERGKFLVVFLLLSTVEDPLDPMNEVFRAFYQKLKRMEDILFICKNKETFQRWKDLQAGMISEEEMEERCIYNLGNEELNGTILRLKSTTRSASRFLPSHSGSTTILLRKDEDLMTSLDILCVNECQDTEIESDKSKFQELLKDREEHFYRGGKATWWNFYFSSKNYTGPFIKRDVQTTLKEQIESWSNCGKPISVKIITLFHHPGCGGTTTAMHVLWELRKTFRCATLNRKTDNFSDIAKEVATFSVYGSPSRSEFYPVVLLVDEFEDEESVSILQNNFQSAIAERYIRHEKPVVIIVNCVRSQNPELSAKSYPTNSVALTNKLSKQEQRAFKRKLDEIEKNHENPEHFYSFMIMKTNFDKTYIENTVRNTLKGLKEASKTTQLISFIALLNKYVKHSTISVSMCEEFLGITAVNSTWLQESIEDIIGSYATIFIRTEVEEYGRYEGLRIIHPLIAQQCIEELKNTYHIQQSNIMLGLLQTNVFHDAGIGREILTQNMQSMLVTRHRKEHGYESDTLFSPLIEEIYKDEGSLNVETVLKEGTIRFRQNPFICQALARHFYIREKNFTDSFDWAKKAVRILPSNSFILDTLGQIYKSQLKAKMEAITEDNPISPEELDVLLKMASNASETFEECQEQTEKSEKERSECEKSNSRHYGVYNTAGYLGQIEVCLYTVDVLLYIPWFKSNDKLSRKHLKQFLSGRWDISVDNVSEDYEEFNHVLGEHRPFLMKLKASLKKAFAFFQDYFVYMKQKTVNKESTEFKTRVKVSEHRKKYIDQFYDQDLMQIISEKDQKKKSDLLCKEEYRAGLEQYKADKFSGIMEYLTDHGKDVKKMESIVKAYTYLLEKSTHESEIISRDKQNCILANIVLHCISPKSAEIKPVETLEKYLTDIMRNIGLHHKYPEPYFLASLLFWPQNLQKLDSKSEHIGDYVIAMKQSFRGNYRHMFRAKQPVAHFYLGKEAGLNRLIHKGKIDRNFPQLPLSDLNSLWQSGDIWKEKKIEELLLLVHGVVKEDDMIYVERSNATDIPVRPVYLGKLRSGKSIERVTFYLGFSIDGPIAYNIEII
ncbi:sterile alpha motif domain-containing protein 9-like [Ranitomeya variabilis]|uniref:sterile alpha motif domain-containing protein 9-like n=1 Tax=Ranitomeya variabilis TaxID=490064 RepID=UPI004057C916